MQAGTDRGEEVAARLGHVFWQPAGSIHPLKTSDLLTQSPALHFKEPRCMRVEMRPGISGAFTDFHLRAGSCVCSPNGRRNVPRREHYWLQCHFLHTVKSTRLCCVHTNNKGKFCVHTNYPEKTKIRECEDKSCLNPGQNHYISTMATLTTSEVTKHQKLFNCHRVSVSVSYLRKY